MKLTDFGLCHFLKYAGSEYMSFRPAFTKGWMRSTDTMDEEGNRHLSVDIFALGLVIGFSASSGVHPFDRNLEMAHKRIKKQKPMTLTLQQLDTSARFLDLMDLINKMLHFDASKRPTASEAEVLLRFILMKQLLMVPQMQQEVDSNMEPFVPIALASTAYLPIGGALSTKKSRSAFHVKSKQLELPARNQLTAGIFNLVYFC